MSTRPAPAVELQAVDAAPCIATFSLRVSIGERVALVGHNGVGKTTLLRLMAGLSLPARGRVDATAPIGYVPQDYRDSFLPWLTAERNLLLGLRAAGLARDQARARLAPLLSALAVDQRCLADAPQRLSGGQQQLLSLARALVASPRLLLLDEPFGALDGARRALAREAVATCAARERTTVVLVSHDVEDIVAVADRVVALGERPMRIVAELPVTTADRAPLAELLARCVPEP